MTISRKDVEHIAKLTRLALTENEIERYGAQLGQVLGYIGKLNELNVEGVLPTSHTLAGSRKNTARQDKAERSGHSGDIIQLAPGYEGRFIKVKKVIE